MTRWPLANSYRSVQPLIGVVPVLVIVMLTWKLPGHEVITRVLDVHVAGGRSASATRNTLGFSSSAGMSVLAAMIWPSVRRKSMP